MRLAPKFKYIKFVKIRSTQAIENWPEKNLPTVFFYHGGELNTQLITLSAVGGKKMTADGKTVVPHSQSPPYYRRMQSLSCFNVRSKIFCEFRHTYVISQIWSGTWPRRELSQTQSSKRIQELQAMRGSKSADSGHLVVIQLPLTQTMTSRRNLRQYLLRFRSLNLLGHFLDISKDFQTY